MGLFYILHQQEMRHKYVGGTNHRFSALHTCVNIRKRMSFMAWRGTPHLACRIHGTLMAYPLHTRLPFCGGCLDQDG